MQTFVVRLWVPDRPGALGQVASRIGAVRGDVVGIDILETGNGQAVDELVVQLPDASVVDLLVHEIGQVDGVKVEEIRSLGQGGHDPRLDALETAAVLVEQTAVEGLLAALAEHARHVFEAEWAAVIDLDAPLPLASVGEPPTTAWLGAFVDGSRHSAKVTAGECGPDEVAWAPLKAADLALVLGRRARPFRARERRQLAALARIADTRWMELVAQAGRLSHPAQFR